jgi:hypothetical protein
MKTKQMKVQEAETNGNLQKPNFQMQLKKPTDIFTCGETGGNNAISGFH